MEEKQDGRRTSTAGRMNETVVQCTTVVEAMKSLVSSDHLQGCKLQRIEAAGRPEGWMTYTETHSTVQG
jgi:hypothetical protein